MNESVSTPENAVPEHSIPETVPPSGYNSMYDGLPEMSASEPEKFSKTEHIAAICALLGGFLIVRLFFYHVTGLFTTLLCWVMFTLEIVFLCKTGHMFRKSDKCFAAVLYLFSAVYTITANGLLKGLNTVFLVMAGCLFLFRMAFPDIDVLRYLTSSLGRAVLASPFAYFSKVFPAASSGAKSKAFWKNALYIFIGLVIALPVTAIVASLLIKADENMSALLGNFLKIPPKYLLDLVPCFFIGLLVGAAVFSTLYCSLHKKLPLNIEEHEKQLESCRFVPNPVIYAAVTPVCVLYLLFFISQIQYFMGGFTGETAGFTYAEYARRGFFELCAVCCINLAMLTCIGTFARFTGAVKPLLLKIYSVYLCICSLLLAGTTLSKMFMYIRTYGMTRLRVYTTWFMLLLVIGFTALLIRQFAVKLNLGRIAAVSFTIMFGLLCFSRPDAWIVRYNAEMYLAGQLEEFDDSVLDDMSPDAWAALSRYSDEELYEISWDTKISVDIYTEMPAGADFYEKLNISAWELMLR